MNFKIFLKYRFWILFVAMFSVVFWYYLTDPNGGAETIIRLQWMAWLTVLAAPVYLFRRALMDGARSNEAYKKAIESPTGAGLVFLGLCILTGMLFLAFVSQANSQELPKNSYTYLPVLNSELNKFWNDSERSYFAGQVEQESCRSLTHSKCWSPTAELKTDREWGIGLGQVTITKKFDNFAEARKLDKSLKDWKIEDRNDAVKQSRALVLMDRQIYRKLNMIEKAPERFAMMFSAYNGGLGGVLSDRRLCAKIDGCNPNLWFDNVELYSLKKKTKTKGYGKSFFEINREYPRNIMFSRNEKYKPWFEANK